MTTHTDTSSGSRALWIPLLLLPLLVPIANTNTTLLGAELPLGYDNLRLVKALVVGVLALVAIVMWARAAKADGRGIAWPTVMWLLAALLGLATVSAIASVNRPSAFFGSYDYRQGLLMIAVLMSVTFVTVQVLRDASGARALAAAVVIGSVPVAIYGLMQVFGVGFGEWGAPDWALARGFSTLGNPDNYGGYLIFPNVLAFGLAMSEEQVRSRIAYWAAFGLASMSLLLTQVRGAWLGAVVAGAVGVVYLWRRHVRLQRVDIVAIVLALAILLGAGIWAGDSIATRVGDMFSGEDDAGSGRWSLWATGVRAVGEYPLLGAGPDSFRFGYYMARGLDHEALGGFASVADDAHNLPIMVAATLGVPALLVAAAFFGIVLFHSGKSVFSKSAESTSTIYGAWFAAVVGHTIYLLFGPSSITTNMLLMLGVGLLIGLRASSESKIAATSTRWFAGSLATVALAVAVTSALGVVADHDYLRSLNAEGEEALAAAESAIARAPWTYRYHARRAALLGEIAEAASGDELLGAAEDALIAYEDLALFAPAEYQTYTRYAAVMLNLNELEERSARVALDAATRGIAVYPSGLEARTLGAVACLRLGSPADAVTLLKDDWNTDSEYADPMVMYAYGLIGTGEFDKAEEVVDTLEETNPDDDRISGLRQTIQSARSQTD